MKVDELMVIDAENRLGMPCSNSGSGFIDLLCANAFWKGMNLSYPVLLFLAMGKIVTWESNSQVMWPVR